MNAARLLAHYDQIADAPDAITRLRRLILDLAVRGKLVPQDAADVSPVNVLAEARRQLRAQAETAKRMRWKQTDPVAKAEIDKDAPPGWVAARLNDTGLYINGLAFKPADWKQSGIPIIRIQNLTDPNKEFNFAQGSFPDEVVVRNGDLLVSWSATLEAFKWDRSEGVLNQHIFRVIPYEGLTDRGFLLLLLRHAIREMADSEHAHGLVMTHINRGPFLNHVVLIPPLPEQHRIVAKVDELMGLCDRLEAARAAREATRDRLAAASLARLSTPDPETFRADARFALDALPALTVRPDQIKRLRQTILNLAVRGKLVPQDANDEPASELLKRIAKEIPSSRGEGQIGEPLPYSLPEGWAWINLGRLVAHSDAGWSPKTEDFRRSGDEWGVLKVSAVSWDKFRPWENKQVLQGTDARLQAEVKKGDFLISRANTSELIARAVIVDEEPVKLMMSDKIVRLFLSKNCNHRFVWIVNNYADFARAHYVERASGVSPSMKNVSRDVILGLPFPLPPLAEQHRIVAKVDTLMVICDRLEACLTATSATRRRLLEALLAESLVEPESVAA